MTQWTFRNITAGGSECPVTSSDHAVELLKMHSARTAYGVVLEYTHAVRGLIACTANADFSTVSFTPTYCATRGALIGFRHGMRVQPVTKEPFYFVDNVGDTSSIPARLLLPIQKVARALKFIIEEHDFPNFIRWSGDAQEMQKQSN